MGETDTNTQGTPQTTGQSSGDDKGSTSTQEPETYTKEQFQKKLSDELAAAGRDAKSLAQKEAALKSKEEAFKETESKIAEWEKAREAEDLEKARDNPELLNAFQMKKQLREEKAKLAEERAQFLADKTAHEELINNSKELQREIAIWEIAGDKIDPAKLKELCNKLGAQTEEQIKAIAENLLPVATPSTGESGDGKKPPLKVDSGVTVGAGEKSEEQRLKERYPTMK
jgi:hypothetical protein